MIPAELLSAEDQRDHGKELEGRWASAFCGSGDVRQVRGGSKTGNSGTAYVEERTSSDRHGVSLKKRRARGPRLQQQLEDPRGEFPLSGLRSFQIRLDDLQCARDRDAKFPGEVGQHRFGLVGIAELHRRPIDQTIEDRLQLDPLVNCSMHSCKPAVIGRFQGSIRTSPPALALASARSNKR
jgi:hypothetical protein